MYRTVLLVLSLGLTAQGIQAQLVGDLSFAGEAVRAIVRRDGVLFSSHAGGGLGTPSQVQFVSATGRVSWTRQLSGKIFATEDSRDGLLVVSTTDDAPFASTAVLLRHSDGSPIASWSLRDGEAASVLKDSGGIVVFSDPEGTPSRRVEVWLPNSGSRLGLVAETPVCNVAAADAGHVFVARFNGQVDAYEGRTVIWTRRVANSLTGQDMQLSVDGRTLFVPTRGVSFAVLDTDTGDVLYQYDANNPTITFSALGMSDLVAAEAERRAKSGQSLTPQQLGAALRGELTADGHIRFHDNTRLDLPFDIDVDPRTQASIRLAIEPAVRAALKSSAHADAQSPGRSLGMRAVIQVNDASTLAAMVIGNKLYTFALR